MFVVKVLFGDKCRNAGNTILESLKEIHSNEQGIPVDIGLIDLEEIHVDNSDVELSNKLIYENCLEIFAEKPRVVFLGGDGSISYSIGKAFLENCRNDEKEPCLIVFDAHADCVKGKGKFPTNKEWLRALIENGFPSENILIVGARNLKKEEIVFLKEKGIRIISMNQMLLNLEDTCDIIMEFSNGKELYFSLDIDVVDCAFAPAVESPESGGLSSREILYLIQRINKMKNLRVVDIVEVNSENDDGRTVGLGGKILSELV